MKSICIIIPVHKSVPSADEIHSLKQCRKVLSGYDTYLVHPEGMNADQYLSVHPGLKLLPIQAGWLSSLVNYNRMKRDIVFYRMFERYEYLLTYELDAFIFSDNWQTANCFSYDYIGAPWFKNWQVTDNPADVMGAGNSGFSLRNIKSCIKVLELREQLKKTWQPFSRLFLHRLFRFTLFTGKSNSYLRSSATNTNFFQLMDDNIMEDIFWADVVPQVFHFTKGNVSDSIKFSFEINPSLLFKMNKEQLPLGCHAWQKYDPAFWAKYI